MAPALTNNIMLGQLRRTVGIVTQLAVEQADPLRSRKPWTRSHFTSGGAAGRSATRHSRAKTASSSTVSHVQRLLRAVGAANTGEKAAAAAIATMQARGLDRRHRQGKETSPCQSRALRGPSTSR